MLQSHSPTAAWRQPVQLLDVDMDRLAGSVTHIADRPRCWAAGDWRAVTTRAMHHDVNPSMAIPSS